MISNWILRPSLCMIGWILNQEGAVQVLVHSLSRHSTRPSPVWFLAFSSSRLSFHYRCIFMPCHFHLCVCRYGQFSPLLLFCSSSSNSPEEKKRHKCLKEKLIFKKCNIHCDIKAPGSRIIASTAFLMCCIAQKYATNCAWIKFASLIFMKMDICHTSKYSWWKHKERR